MKEALPLHALHATPLSPLHTQPPSITTSNPCPIPTLASQYRHPALASIARSSTTIELSVLSAPQKPFCAPARAAHRRPASPIPRWRTAAVQNTSMDSALQANVPHGKRG